MTDRFDVALAMSEWFNVNDDKPRLRAGNTSASHIYVIGDSLLPTVKMHRRLCRGRVLGEWFEAAPADIIDALTEAIKQVIWQARNEHKANDRPGAQGEQQAADQTAA